MNFENRIKGIREWINNGAYLEDSLFNKNKLFEQKYLNFQIDDCYDFFDVITGDIRNDIFEILYYTYSNWKQELIDLKIPFYLGVWIYDPRLPKSEIVCAIGAEKIEYYEKKCFDLTNEKNELIDIMHFKEEKNILKWTQKIDSDTLYEWEINFPKENYENENQWKKDQIKFKEFIKDSYKTLKYRKENVYFKKVGDIWIGEFIMK